MYEFAREPALHHLMRHQAWEIQQDAVSRCRAITAAAYLPASGPSGPAPVFALGAALQLLGLSAPQSYALPGEQTPVVFDAPRSMRRVPGATPMMWAPLAAPHAVTEVAGLRCTSPAATFAHMARFCSLEHLVALGDAMTCRDRTLRRATLASLQGFVDDAGRFIGRPNALRALRLVRENTDSPAETRLRLLAMQFGLPCPQPDVIIAIDPEKIRIDMGWPQYRVGLDYQGAHHRTQYEDDLYRANAILTHRWTVFQVTSTMIATERRAAYLLAQVWTALQRAGAPLGRMPVEPMPLNRVGNAIIGSDEQPLGA